MPAKKLKQPKQVKEKLPEAGGKRLVSLIPVVRKRGRPSLASKFNPTVDIKEALTRLGKGFFTGEEEELFKTPLKVRPVESQKSAARLSNSPSRSTKKAAGALGSDSRGSPGSKTSSPDSPYFLRSRGVADGALDESVLQRRRRRKSAGFDSAEKQSPAGKAKPVGVASVGKESPAGKTKPVGVASVEKGSPARRGRKSLQSLPNKTAEAEKPVKLTKAARASLPGGKYYKVENSVLEKRSAKSTKKDLAEPSSAARAAGGSRRRTKTSPNLSSEESADDAEKGARVAIGKKRKRESDEADDTKTKRMRVELTQIRDVVQEPSPMTTMKLVVHRANIKDLGDKVALNDDGKQGSYSRVEVTRHVEEKRTAQVTPSKDFRQTVTAQSGTTEFGSAVIDNHSTSSRGQSSAFESVGSSAFSGSVQRLREASGGSDETFRKQLHDLTADILVRNSWSAHLYDKLSSSASKTPRALTSENSEMEAPRPLRPRTPSIDNFQMNWDTSALKEQLISSVLPRQPLPDELGSVPVTFNGGSNPSSSFLKESTVVLTSSVATPLGRPYIEKHLFESDVVELRENTRVSRKTVCVEEETETRRGPSSRPYPAVPFNTPVQPLRGNGASLRRSVDRMLPAVDRVNIVRGRSVEPSMIRSESIHRQPKSNGQTAAKGPNLVVEMSGGRSGRVCRRLLCLVGTSVIAIGAACLVNLALAAGYLGEFF